MNDQPPQGDKRVLKITYEGNDANLSFEIRGKLFADVFNPRSAEVFKNLASMTEGIAKTGQWPAFSGFPPTDMLHPPSPIPPAFDKAFAEGLGSDVRAQFRPPNLPAEALSMKCQTCPAILFYMPDQNHAICGVCGSEYRLEPQAPAAVEDAEKQETP